MSEEELKKTIDIVASIEVHSEAEATAKEELISYIEQLEKELNDSNRIAVERRDHILILKQKLDFALKDISSLKKQKRELEEEILKILEGKQKHIEQLRKRNKELKEILENNSKINVADHKYASEMEDKYLDEHNILTEFEKWLEENYCLYIPEIKQNSAIGKVYDKLQELKNKKID